MSLDEYLAVPKEVPRLIIPKSTSTVDVRIIDSTGIGSANADMMMAPHIKGFDRLTFPCLVFLISNANNDAHILFDLGIRKDWETGYPPGTMKFVGGENPMMKLEVERNVQDIMNEDVGGLGIKSDSISAVIWSHHHFDHRGDVSGVPNADIIVGPGFSGKYLPPYPEDPNGEIHEDEIKGRKLREFSIDAYNLDIGGYPALDFFGDGSFYLLSAPGHTVGHVCALARVTSSSSTSNDSVPQQDTDTFIFMGADCAHYCGEFRPSEYLPLPTQIEITTTPKTQNQPSPHPVKATTTITKCPGAWIQEHIHPTHSATKPFNNFAPHVNHDQKLADESIAKMMAFDAAENVLVCVAHDHTLLQGELDLYPKTMNGWKATGCKGKVRWKFCSDFDVGVEGVKV